MDMKSLVWCRRDLRVHDHRALYEALAISESLDILFIFDKQIIEKLDKEDKRLSIIYSALKDIEKKLEKTQHRLIIKYGNPIEIIPALMKNYDQLFFNRDYEPYARKRDSKIIKTIGKDRINHFKDHVIFEANEILKDDNSFFKVYTPYKRKWLEKLSSREYQKYNIKLKEGKSLDNIIEYPKKFILKLGKYTHNDALEKIEKFNIKKYSKDRDYFYKNGTSSLSEFLRFGIISTRELVRHSLKFDNDRVWLSEIIWRDFYQMILFHNPRIINENFNKKFDSFLWENDKNKLKAWCLGKTGFPIIDAAMRELNQTGRMHNRLRMITASFLTKLLLVDWRYGERYFAKKLLDFDLAANNGGWQWSAGTGTDAQPYFRIFNPENQSRKFDENAEYIKKWCPELKKALDPHNPSEEDRVNLNYPKAIIDYKERRKYSLELSKSLK